MGAALALTSCGGALPGAGDIAPELKPGCQETRFEEVPLTVCVADPQLHTIRTALAPETEAGGGPPWRSLAAFAANRSPEAPQVMFAFNAGMFDDDGQPIGYYVENGEKVHSLSRKAGPGNFHMLPNGVFFGRGGKWEVRSTEDFFSSVTNRPDFGTQSGPMLVVDGELHPGIQDDGASLRIRNAVGVEDTGRAIFVISDQPISFGKLARYYRDVLKVRNALFLDGTVSQLWNPQSKRLDNTFPIGPLIMVERRTETPAKP
ncbi:phosphodiester glycosidase family protein [Erythrobacter sp. SG61-1L]|uniref:phosphodiester glycosidase family protein n=1 Tax=Erythrobacter sp. SG61-1L TaxID=1603897 RepID=UPI001F525316|nr:phosphodiester glycosidase family protein [Erythrobacter sp. SG61-1L]